MATYEHKSDTINELLDTYVSVVDALPANWKVCLEYFLNSYVTKETTDYKVVLKDSRDEGFRDHDEFTLFYNEQGLVNFMKDFKKYCKTHPNKTNVKNMETQKSERDTKEFERRERAMSKRWAY